jgi:hypothetical protein
MKGNRLDIEVAIYILRIRHVTKNATGYDEVISCVILLQKPHTIPQEELRMNFVISPMFAFVERERGDFLPLLRFCILKNCHIKGNGRAPHRRSILVRIA